MSPDCDAYLSFNRDGESAQNFPMQKTAFGWSITLSVPKIGLYYYTFLIDGHGFISRNTMEKGELTQAPKGFLLTVYSKGYKTPDWFKGGVMYQIFPDRFYKSGTMSDINGRIKRKDWGGIPFFRPNEQGKVLNTDFFGGNFKGVMKKLPYLKKLGITCIYFNPVFEAASNHRYDTSDYMKIDPYLGTEKDFVNLVKAAENQGIRIILDGVFNHTGDNSVYFNKYGNYPS
ncbi:MAG: glycoside hydrolase family 13 protein, partial [Clostridia bacterium]|nr:glycoside hydrolase family 13 protein [Clostridia bacterium]